ncbi:hypothetical protein RFI_01740 [Reticulomyxa filosa]|uniref:Uncharacterized protein n=1 Tax=Reticulomyxa filosa TaxID=46433 RepID=X6PB19_RETFI|nr:hypothetical protein RFI_01740 [Reticulomyxa filosa]|eukprot:ETO35323.1 hypothetical protein RFI_01740 [Reticulomyxa filosa]
MKLAVSDIELYLFVVCNEFKEYEIGDRHDDIWKKEKEKTNVMDSWLNNHSKADVNDEDDDRNEKEKEK